MHLKIETERLVLTPVEEADAADTAKLMTSDVAANLLSWPTPLSADQALVRIRNCRSALECRQGLHWGVRRRFDGVLMGWLGVWLRDPVQRSATLGFWLGTRHQGQSFMAEASVPGVCAALNFVSARSLEGACRPDNHRSIAIFRRLGMTSAGQKPIYSPKRAKYEISNIYSLDVG